MVREYPITERPRRCPTHPGAILRDDAACAETLSQ